MEVVLVILSLDDHIVNVDLHYVVDLLAEHAGDHPLIGGSGVLEAKGHDFVVESALGVMKDVFSMSSSAIEIWWYPLYASKKLRQAWPAVASTS